MTTRSRGIALCLGLFSMLLLASASTHGQDPTQSKAGEGGSAVYKRKYDPSRRVPPYFGQIALSAEQRESIYKIRKSHTDKIDALKKEIDKIEEQMMADCEGVLNETQKKLLDNLRRSGSATTKPTEPTEKPKTPAKKS